MKATRNLSAWSVSALSIATCSALWYFHHRRVVRLLEEKRLSERTGRIRAEVKLRSSSKASKQGGLTLTQIGYVQSPFTKRMGTPRQGALVPSSRAFVQLVVPMETLQGIDGYSHAWIIFLFHANTDLAESKKTKIRPPRAPKGVKVGQLATRSPHRPNPIGLSLIRIEYVDYAAKRLYISALDIVNGTPVFDIKPVVPWDQPASRLVVPSWVEQDDELSQVSFTPKAQADLRQAISSGLMQPLYAENNSGFEAALETIKQLLAQDPRASHRRGTSTSMREPSYRIVFCRAQLEFKVSNDSVKVLSVRGADLADADYVDGIPLIGLQ